MDLKALKKMGSELDSPTDGDFIYTKEITEDGIDIRIMPPSARMAGVPFVKVIRYWINKKPYICPSTFGRASVIQEEIEEAKAEGDPELLDLCENKETFDKKVENWWGVLHLDAWDPNGDQRDKPIVIGGKVKVLPAGPMITKELIKVVVSKQAQNKTTDGIADRVKGFNVILSKTGQGKKTEYRAEKWDTPQEMPKTYYDNCPDIVKMVEDNIKSDAYLRGVIRNYLYGEDMPKEETSKKKEETKKPVRNTAKPKREEVIEEEDEDEDVEEEVEQEEFEEEEEEIEEVKPVKKTTATTKNTKEVTKAATKTTKPVQKPTETKKVTRNVLQDVEDDLEDLD